MDLHLLPGGGDHHDPDDRLAGAAALGTPPGGDDLGGLPGVLAALLVRLEPGKHDRVPRHAGFHRRRADSAGVHPGPGQVAGTPPSEGHGAVRHHRHLRALHRTDPGRLADGKLRLGIHLLYQRAAGPVDDRRAALRPGEKGAALGTAEEYRLRRHRHPRHRPGLPAGFPRGRSPQGLAGVATDRQPRQRRPVQPGPVRHPATVAAKPADRPGHPAQPQLRPREHFQHRSGHGPVRLDLRTAAVPGTNPGLQRHADRRGDHVDGHSPAVPDPAGPEVDEAGLAAPALRRRLRPVRPCQLLLRGAQPGLRRTAVQPDPATARPRPADDHGDHFADRHRLPAATGCRLGLEPVQHPAQPRRRHRHRPARDPARQSRQGVLRLSARSPGADQPAGRRTPRATRRATGQPAGGAGQTQRDHPPAGDDHGLQRCFPCHRHGARSEHARGAADPLAAGGGGGPRRRYASAAPGKGYRRKREDAAAGGALLVRHSSLYASIGGQEQVRLRSP